MIQELNIITDTRLCGCPMPHRVQIGLRMPDSEVILWVRCASCGTEMSRPTKGLKTQLILEETT